MSFGGVAVLLTSSFLVGLNKCYHSLSRLCVFLVNYVCEEIISVRNQIPLKSALLTDGNLAAGGKRSLYTFRLSC